MKVVLLAAVLAIYPCSAQLWSPAFAVASIKPSDRSRPGLRLRVGPDSFASSGTLIFFVEQAYDLPDFQVAGGAPWLTTTRYDVQAKAEKEVSPQQIRIMLQDLLVQRFNLKFHRETRTMRAYVLSVEKGGAKLPPPKQGLPPDSRGVVQMGGGEIWGRGATMKTLAGALKMETSLPVVDQTGMEGNYDFRLHFDEGNNALADTAAGSDATPNGSVFTALRELGLRLDARKVDMEVLVIDSAAMPSQN